MPVLYQWFHVTWIRRILACLEAVKRRVDRLWCVFVEFRQFLTIG